MGVPEQAGRPQARSEPDDLATAAREALVSAALRLGVDPMKLANGALDAELAEVILELRVARHTLADGDKARVEDLLRRLGVLP